MKESAVRMNGTKQTEIKPIKRKPCAAGKAAADPERFSGTAPRRRAFVRFSVWLPVGACAWFGARERSERVTARRQPHRQRSRRLVYITSARPIAITVTFPYIKGISAYTEFLGNRHKK